MFWRGFFCCEIVLVNVKQESSHILNIVLTHDLNHESCHFMAVEYDVENWIFVFSLVVNFDQNWIWRCPKMQNSVMVNKMITTTNIQYLSLTPISTFDGLSKWHKARIYSIQIDYNFCHQVSNWWELLDFFTFRNMYLITQTIIILTILMNYVWLMDKKIIFAVVAILGQIRRKFHP